MSSRSKGRYAELKVAKILSDFTGEKFIQTPGSGSGKFYVINNDIDFSIPNKLSFKDSQRKLDIRYEQLISELEKDEQELKTKDESIDEKLSELGPCVSIFGSARTKEDDPFYKQTVKIAKKIVGMGLGVITGGGPGIMEAANKGAQQAGGISVGLNIDLPFEAAVPSGIL